MKIFKILFFLIFLSSSFSVAKAQHPWDPYESDTVYFEASGLHSADGCTLYVPREFPADIAIDVKLKTDNLVASVIIPLIDLCYDSLSMPTYLEPLKNDPDSVELNCFTGTAVENWNIISLNLYGVGPTPTPPNFLIGAICFEYGCYIQGDSTMKPNKVAHLIFTVNNEGCLCLDTISVFQPGGAMPQLLGPIDTYVPVFKFQCFEIRKTGPKRGDVNADGIISLGDPIYLAKYYLKGGPAPYYPGTGDVDCSGLTNLEDVIYLANYLLKGGPPSCLMEE